MLLNLITVSSRVKGHTDHYHPTHSLLEETQTGCSPVLAVNPAPSLKSLGKPGVEFFLDPECINQGFLQARAGLARTPREMSSWSLYHSKSYLELGDQQEP